MRKPIRKAFTERQGSTKQSAAERVLLQVPLTGMWGKRLPPLAMEAYRLLQLRPKWPDYIPELAVGLGVHMGSLFRHANSSPAGSRGIYTKVPGGNKISR